jgi:lipoate---protein ligase
MLNLCHFKGLSIFRQLQMEEALLRVGSGNWCFINEGSPKAIVMGISGKAHELIDKEQFNKNPVPVIRRFSGGGTVVVEENTLFVTFIFEKKELGIETCPQKLLQWSLIPYAEVFSGIDFHLKENDYCIGDKKIGGNAQYFTKDRLLHHTSFLWDWHPETMNLLTIPPKVPEYRKKRDHAAFLTALKHHFASKDTFVHKLKESLHAMYNVHEVSESAVQPYLDRPHRTSLRLEIDLPWKSSQITS